ncbi:terminal uridylyltransferase 7-like [Haemaphysalis longicornis]
MSDAKLTLFGSSCNGFGFARSDLDVCLTFARSEDGKDLCLKDMVWAIAKKLRYFPSELTRPLALTHPKVPIIRFFHVPTELQVDISLYNTLALENTRLLRAYCDIDPRVQQLGCYIKNFAKRKDIADASKGGLSSYAFILMMIFYLQQCRPPVVPVLQELYPEGDTKPEFLVDSWNTWFFEDTSFLDEVWTGFGKNDWSVAELWAGLLQFYATEFDFTKDVVCVRRKAPLTMSEKGWASNLAIEENALIMCSLLDEWRVLVASKIKIPFAWCEDKQ